jgi:hypothetical protein
MAQTQLKEVKAYRNRKTSRVFEPTAILARLKDKLDLEELYELPKELGGKSSSDYSKTRRQKIEEQQEQED